MLLTLKIAITYLFADRRRSVITSLIVSFGMAMFIFLTSSLAMMSALISRNVTGSGFYTNVLLALIAMDTLMIAGLGIYNSLSRIINDKIKDIAILKIIGFTEKDISNILFSCALMVGLAGTIAGSLVGFSLSKMVSKHTVAATGIVDTSSFPVTFYLQHLASGIAIGILTVLIAAIAASRKAAGINPVKILRSS